MWDSISLSGYWVCHPALVRPGLALMYDLDQLYGSSNDSSSLMALLADLILDPAARDTIWNYAQVKIHNTFQVHRSS